MIKKSLAAAVLAITSLSTLASTVHTYDFTYDGTLATANLSAQGAQLANGDIVNFDFKALGNDYFSFGGGYIWIPVSMVECGTRVGDMTMQLLNDGVQVAAASYVGDGSSCVHIPNGANFAAVDFDEVRWAFTQTSTDTTPNTLGGIFSESRPFLIDQPAYVRVPDSDVPEPGTLVLLGFGLASLVTVRRKR